MAVYVCGLRVQDLYGRKTSKGNTPRAKLSEIVDAVLEL